MAVQLRSECTIRPITTEDLSGLLDIWVQSWQAAYPSIDFKMRRNWAAERFAELERNGAQILVAEAEGQLVGAISVESSNGYIDQIVVATTSQRRGIASRLIGAARVVSPGVLQLHVNQDNLPAIAFYRREGFSVDGHSANERSGAPTYRMTWRA